MCFVYIYYKVRVAFLFVHYSIAISHLDLFNRNRHAASMSGCIKLTKRSLCSTVVALSSPSLSFQVSTSRTTWRLLLVCLAVLLLGLLQHAEGSPPFLRSLIFGICNDRVVLES